MTFALGFLTGMGQAQHELNVRDYHEQLEAEKTANQNTLDTLKGLMSADNVDPETRDTALKAYLNFTQTKGMPSAKHRSAALEPVMQSFGRKRSSPRADMMMTTAEQMKSNPNDALVGSDLTGSREGTEYSNPRLPSSMGFTSENLPSTPTGPTPLDAVKRNVRADTETQVAGSLPKRTGFLQPDEVGQRKGIAEGEQMKARWGVLGTDPLTVMGLGPDGAAGGGNNPVSYVADLNTKSGVKPIYNSSSFHNYETVDGRKGTARYDTRRGITQDSATGAVLPPGTLMTSPDGTHWVTKVNADNTVTQTPVSNLTGQARSEPIDAGQKFTGLQTELMHKRSQAISLSNEQKSIDVNGTYSDGTIPAWQPTTTDANGNVVPVPGRTAKYVITAGNERKAQSSLQTVDMINQLRDHLRSIRGKFGVFNGTVEELLSKYINDPEVRAMAPIIHEHLPSAIAGMYGFRAYQSKQDYGKAIDGAFHTFLGQPLANVEAALDSTYQIAKQARDEAMNPVYNTPAPTARPGTSATPAAATPKHKVGDRVMYKGKSVTVKAIYPDGSYEVE
jgi:hypothetical protein